MTLSELVAKVEGRMDGPHADEDTAAAAWLTAESVRYLNYASGSHSPTGMEFPATVYLVTSNLSIAASRMPQLFEQLRHWLGEQLRAGMLGTDDGTPVDPAITAACLHLLEAAGRASRLAANLATVQNDLAYINGHGSNRARTAVAS